MFFCAVSSGQNENIESKLRNLQNDFSEQISSNNCVQYLKKIDYLIIEAEELFLKNSSNSELKALKNKIEAFKNFTSTLTDCGGSGDQVSLKYFHELINATNLSPKLFLKNDCGEIYGLNIGSFNTFYVINMGKSKTYSIIIRTATDRISYKLASDCKSARGFCQGDKLANVVALELTCTALDDWWCPE